jgi:hypothetical protein
MVSSQFCCEQPHCDRKQDSATLAVTVDGKRHHADRNEHVDEVAAASSCPAPECGALVVTYGPPDRMRRDTTEPWKFSCPRCRIDFAVTEEELIFQSVPKRWLLARVQVA